MNWLIIPLFIWLTALLIMMLPKIIIKKIDKLKAELITTAIEAEHTNPAESKNRKITEDIMDTVHIKSLAFTSSIIASVLIALGTLVFCIVLLL